MGSLESSFERVLVEQIRVAVLSDCEEADGIVLAAINDVYRSALKPLAECHAAIVDELQMAPQLARIVLAGPRASAIMPMHLVSTFEFAVGSQSVVASSIIYHMERTDFGVPSQTVETESLEWWSRPRLRPVTVRLIGLVTLVRLCVRVCLLNMAKVWLRRAGAPSGQVAILFRSAHHARFVNALVACAPAGEVPLVLYCPQFLHGSARQDLELLASVRGALPDVPSVGDLVSSLLQGMWRVRSNSPDAATSVRLGVPSSSLCVEMELVVREVRLMPVFSVYVGMLRRYLGRKPRVGRVVNFEMVGRQAGLDRVACSRSSRQLVSIQTVALLPVVLPVFPFADRFLADSPSSHHALAEVAGKEGGRVEFCGSPYVYAGDTSSVGTDRLRRLTFFTQPYEPQATEQMLRCLRELALQHGWRFAVRLHPRDSWGRYSENWSEAKLPRDVLEVLSATDIAVGRTSSVLKEAIALGIPAVACSFTETDRKQRVDYVDVMTASGLVAHNIDELVSLCERSAEELSESAATMKRTMFGSLGMSELALNVLTDKSR